MGSWNLEVVDGIGLLELNEPDTEVNILTTENLTELKSIIETIPSREDIKALLFTSAKPRIFIAGANINEIKEISTEKDAYDKAEQGKEVFQLIEDLKIPTITVINGACLGGGYELALSCSLRVAAYSDKVKVGLPEVNLGILPGFGGSIRLPRLLGLMEALPLILAGKMLDAEKAAKKGLVDKLFPEGTLKENAIAFAHDVIKKGPKAFRKKRKTSLVTSFFEDSIFGRSLVFKQAKKGVLKKTKGVYPAPLQIIDLLAATYGKKGKKVYELESKHFAKLGATEVSKNLIKLFFTNEEYKKKKWTELDAKSAPVQKCGVIGAGVMGGGIAHLVSHRNIPVRVKDINEEALAGALKEAWKIYSGAIKRRRIKKTDRDNKMSLISTGLTNAGLKRCDFIIEAVVESMEIKKKVFEELSDTLPEDTILASNTSSLSVTEMASVTKNPERVVGIHFFNPVNRMPLIEIIRAEKTSDATVEKAVQFSRRLGKTVIVVKDKEGFLVNRLLLPYMNEAAYLLEEGVSAEEIDRIAVKFGMPMGPIELVDQVGVDVGFKVAKILEGAFGERMKVASILEKVYEKKFLGKKSGKGFYDYSGKSKSVNGEVPYPSASNSYSSEDVLKQMIYVMVNEAARCLDEGVVDCAATVDIGMIMGTGFPPFRGGLLHYADKVGVASIVRDLERFEKHTQSGRFKPCDYLLKLADAQQTFYK